MKMSLDITGTYGRMPILKATQLRIPEPTPAMNIAEHKTRAAELGLDWDQVRDIYAELREKQRLEREWKWDVRGTIYVSAGFKSLAHYKAAYRAAFNGGDRDIITRFDELATSVALQHPELGATDEDASEKVWSILCEPVDRMPPADDTYREAIVIAQENAEASIAEAELDDSFKFGAMAADDGQPF